MSEPVTWDVEGRVDFDTAQSQYERFVQHCPEAGAAVQINLQALEHIDSATLAWMLACFRYCQQQRVTCKYVEANPQLLKLANVCGIAKILGIQ